MSYVIVDSQNKLHTECHAPTVQSSKPGTKTASKQRATILSEEDLARPLLNHSPATLTGTDCWLTSLFIAMHAFSAHMHAHIAHSSSTSLSLSWFVWFRCFRNYGKFCVCHFRLNIFEDKRMWWSSWLWHYLGLPHFWRYTKSNSCKIAKCTCSTRYASLQ